MSSTPPITLSHVAAAYKRYPGERVRLHTRVTVLADVTGFILTVTLPSALVLITYRAEWDGAVGELEVADGVQTIRWRERSALVSGRCLDYLIEATIDADQLVWQLADQAEDAGPAYVAEQAAPTVRPDWLHLTSTATVSYGNSDDTAGAALTAPGQFLDETAQITVLAKSNYLQYLPAIYEQDDFMGRFLMLFESFWEPLESQLAQIHHLFDPHVTPNALLPWLAGWYDLELPAGWSEAQKRAIVARVMRLYRRSGAHAGLGEYLRFLTGGKVTITEYAAGSFRIGRDAQLGSGLAFGSANAPHTFAVQIAEVPLAARCEGALSAEECDRRLAQLTDLVAALIEVEKPAHTVCTVLTVEQN